jgi:hypothetical protein
MASPMRYHSVSSTHCFLPRFGFTYDLFNEGFFRSTSINGGVGIFSGGDPSVWFSNAFSNNGFSTGEGTTLAAGCAGLPRNANGQIDVIVNGQFTGFPQCAVDAGSAVAAAGNAPVQSTDPDLRLPSVVRANIGFNTNFGAGGGFFDDWNLKVDYIYSRFRNPLNWADLPYALDYRQGNNGFMVDGRPIYSSIDPLNPGCNAVFNGPSGTNGSFSNVTDGCFTTNREDEVQLTNAGGYNAHAASIVFSKNFNRGIFTDTGEVGLNFGYAFTDADSRRDARSSTATSNFGKSAHFDVQNPKCRLPPTKRSII